MSQTLTEKKNEGGVSAGQANACPQKDGTQQNKMLSLNFIGVQEGRYIFRWKDQPHSQIVGDYDDFHAWYTAHLQQVAVLDAEKDQVERLLAQGREYERTGDRRAFTGGIMVGS